MKLKLFSLTFSSVILVIICSAQVNCATNKDFELDYPFTLEDPKNADPSDLCPLNMEIMNQLLKKAKNEIVQVVSDKFFSVEAESQKQNQVLNSNLDVFSKKLERLERNLVQYGLHWADALIVLNSSLETGFEKIVAKLDEYDQKSQKPQIETENCKKARKLGLTRLETGDYFFHTTAQPWSLARNFCQENGMQLATFETHKEMSKIWHLDPRKGQFYGLWVSASDVGQQPGHFLWADGKKVDAAFWDTAGGYPKHFGTGKEACVMLHAFTGNLWDYPCATSWPFVCELKAQESSCQ